MPRWISAELRKAIAERARFLCEYCLIVETDTFYGCQVDHIISLNHNGSSEIDNLAYACALCKSDDPTGNDSLLRLSFRRNSCLALAIQRATTVCHCVKELYIQVKIENKLFHIHL